MISTFDASTYNSKKKLRVSVFCCDHMFYGSGVGIICSHNWTTLSILNNKRNAPPTCWCITLGVMEYIHQKNTMKMAGDRVLNWSPYVVQFAALSFVIPVAALTRIAMISLTFGWNFILVDHMNSAHPLNFTSDASDKPGWNVRSQIFDFTETTAALKKNRRVRCVVTNNTVERFAFLLLFSVIWPAPHGATHNHQASFLTGVALNSVISTNLAFISQCSVVHYFWCIYTSGSIGH